MDPRAERIGDLLPHGPEMTLVHRFLSYEESRSVVAADIDGRCVFYEGTGVPAWAGIEFMSQAIAAHAGFEAKRRGAPPALGFVLGTRAYESFVDEFPLGCTLTITVEPQISDGGFSAFACTIATDRLAAKAVINVYRPSAAELAELRGLSAGR